MFDLFATILRVLVCGFQSRQQLLLENLALRHQLTVLQRSVPRAKLKRADRFLWVLLLQCWSDWQRVLVIVEPRTVVAWHRAGFRWFWRWKSRPRIGRPPVNRDLVDLIRRMWQTNPTWGSRRIQAELAKLYIAASDSTVRHYRPKPRRSASAQTWKTFLQNHAQALVAVDFFAVPTASFRVLYVFLVLAHERRKILHFNVTEAPSAPWTAQQVVEAFSYAIPPRYLLRDRDGIYGADFVHRVEGLGLEQKLIAPQSPWQNPMIERIIGSIRRECLDHVIVLNGQHLHQILSDYLAYYHQDRTHRSLAQDCPLARPVEPPDHGNIIALPRLGGLHNRYIRQAA
jgi:putative transposase